MHHLEQTSIFFSECVSLFRARKNSSRDSLPEYESPELVEQGASELLLYLEPGRIGQLFQDEATLHFDGFQAVNHIVCG